MSVAQTEFFNDKPKALQIVLVVEEFSLLRPCIHRHLTASRPDLHALTLGRRGMTTSDFLSALQRFQRAFDMVPLVLPLGETLLVFQQNRWRSFLREVRVG